MTSIIPDALKEILDIAGPGYDALAAQFPEKCIQNPPALSDCRAVAALGYALQSIRTARDACDYDRMNDMIDAAFMYLQHASMAALAQE